MKGRLEGRKSWEAIIIVHVRDDGVLDYSSGNRDREKWAELSYILEICMTGVGNGLHVERRDGGDKDDFQVSNVNK